MRSVSAALLALLFSAALSEAQESRSERFAPLVRVGDSPAERLRLREITGDPQARLPLFQSTSRLTRMHGDSVEARPVGFQLISPELRTAWNSDIPYSMNNGSLWAGRGYALQLTAGVRAQLGPVYAVFAPQWTTVENRDFQIGVGNVPGQSIFRPPWRSGNLSADLPLRFGAASYRLLDFGQSALGVVAGPVEAGITTEDAWWGPGVRNALVLSNHAQGIPRLFIRMPAPLETPAGMLDLHWTSGVLTESLFFDSLSDNDLRTFNAFGVSFVPIWVPHLTVGVTRSLVDELGSNDEVFPNGARILAWDPGSAQQVLGMFARWYFPRDGFEVYGELAHHNAPGTLAEALAPFGQTASYTLGLQWARPVSADSARTLRLQAELSNLENRTPPGRAAELSSAYTSRDVVQGYTQRGRSIGAAIGPGSSAQWVGLDYFAPKWQVGGGFSRVRWDTDAFYTQPTGISFIAHDVSLIATLRGGLEVGPANLSAQLIRESRLNYLFQNYTVFTGEEGDAVDLTNYGVRLSVSFTPGRESR